MARRTSGSATGGRGREAFEGEGLGRSRGRELARLAVSDPSYALGALLLIVVLSTAWHVHYSRSAGIDFYQFWLVGHASATGRVSSVYSVEGREELTRISARLAATPAGSRRMVEAARTRAILENFSTPFLYTSFGRFFTGDYETDYERYQLVCLFVLAAAVGWFGRALGYRPIAAFLLILLVVLGFRPALSDLLVGNVTRLELGAVALALGALRGVTPWREIVAGVLFGLLLCFKPNTFLVVALLPLLWLVHRRWGRLFRCGAGVLLGIGFAVGASALHFGSLGPWLEWFAAMGRIEAESNLASQSGNFSLARALMERGFPDLSLALTAGIALAAAVALAIGARRGPLPEGGSGTALRPSGNLFAAEVTTAAVGLGIPLVGFYLAWMHYFVLALPLMFCALRPVALAASGSWATIVRWIAALVGTLLLFGGPLYLFQTSGPPPPALQYSLGTLLLLAIALVDLARGAESPS